MTERMDAMAEADEVRAERLRGYVDMVYGAARRQMGGAADGAAAMGIEDVVQAVFLVMAQKAKQGKLPEERFMAGWLLRVTHYAVKRGRRGAFRQRVHERRAAIQRREGAADDAAEEGMSDGVRAALDEAMLSLGRVDREVVARRYLRGETVGEVGAAVGMGENSVGRRIARALEKLRRAMGKRGVTAPSAVLLAVLGSEAVMKAPAALAAAAGTGSAGAGATAAAKMIMRRMLMAKCAGVASAAGVVLLICAAAAVVLPREAAAAGAERSPVKGAASGVGPEAAASRPEITEGEKVAQAWKDLEKPEPAASRAVLALAARPREMVAMAQGRLVPVQIDAAEVRKQLALLGSDDEKVWLAAYERLTYQDPRLAIGLETLMGEVTDEPARSRLAAVLSDDEPEEAAQLGDVRLQHVGTNYDFFKTTADGGTRSWLAEDKLSRLTNDRRITKKQWVRADRAIAILAQMGTPEALALVKEMATGNAEADPTKVAKAVLVEMAGAATRPAEMESWWRDLEKLGTPGTEALLRFRARPAESVDFLKVISSH